jgi:ankyrin repeat protein
MDKDDIKEIYKWKGRDEAVQAYAKAAEENKDDESMNTLAFLAANRAHPEALKVLFHAGVSPAAADDNGRTLLHHLALQQEYNFDEIPAGAVAETTALLLDNNVSALTRDSKEGMTCYHYAARKGRAEMIAVLAKRGVKLNMIDREGSTGIHIACTGAGFAIDRIPYRKRDMERTKESYAHEANLMKEKGLWSEEQIVQTLADDPALDIKKAQKEYDDAIQLVEDYFQIVKAFVQGGVDIEDENSEGKTALDIAAKNGAKKITAFLSGALTSDADTDTNVSADANTNANTNANANTDISAGLNAGFNAGFNADDIIIAAGGITLHQAAEVGDAEAIKAIAAADVDLNSSMDGKDKKFRGRTPLSIAVACFKDKAVDALLSCGAAPSYKDENSCAALYYLMAYDITAAMNNESIFKEKRVQKIIRSIISAGFDINTTIDDSENTLLILACKTPVKYPVAAFSVKEDVIGELLKCDCDIHKNNRFGETALMHAGSLGSLDFKLMEAVQIDLLKRGADVHAADINGDTALHYAARVNDKTAAKVYCEMLLAFGADANAVNNDQKTAMDFAFEKNNEPLAKMLFMKM